MPSRNYPDPIEGLTPGTIIITEETVETFRIDGYTYAFAPLQNQSFPEDFVPPVELEVLLNGKSYILKCTHPDNRNRNYLYGDFPDIGDPIFDNNPVALRFRMDLLQNFGIWTLVTPEPGTYTISAKIPSAPKVLSFPKGRTIVSELSRLNKAFGTISTKKTIIGQLSDLADAAEAGKIGSGSGEITYVHIDRNIVDDHDVFTADKSYDEISDIISNEIPVSVIDGSAIYPFADRTIYTIRFSRTRVNNGNMFVESYVFTSDGIQQDTQTYDVTPSSNSYT